jgi:hypothetical protein
MLPCVGGAHPLFGYGTPDAVMKKKPKRCCEWTNCPADVRIRGKEGHSWGLAEMVMTGSRLPRDVGRPDADNEERHDRRSKCSHDGECAACGEPDANTSWFADGLEE